jgi:hypothetical protein
LVSERIEFASTGASAAETRRTQGAEAVAAAAVPRAAADRITRRRFQLAPIPTSRISVCPIRDQLCTSG